MSECKRCGNSFEHGISDFCTITCKKKYRIEMWDSSRSMAGLRSDGSGDDVDKSDGFDCVWSKRDGELFWDCDSPVYKGGTSVGVVEEGDSGCFSVFATTGFDSVFVFEGVPCRDEAVFVAESWMGGSV